MVNGLVLFANKRHVKSLTNDDQTLFQQLLCKNPTSIKQNLIKEVSGIADTRYDLVEYRPMRDLTRRY
jgi:hypothetical protein